MPQLNTAASGADQSVICRQADIVSGAPVFPGTRVPVRFLQNTIVQGDTIEAFLHDYPMVSKEQAVAVVELAFERAIGPRDEDNIVR